MDQQRLQVAQVLSTPDQGRYSAKEPPTVPNLKLFDADGRPHEGSAGGVHFSIDYRADGRTVNTFDDGTVIQYDSGGRVTRQETPDGTVYSRFDSQGRPTAGSTPDDVGTVRPVSPSITRPTAAPSFVIPTARPPRSIPRVGLSSRRVPTVPSIPTLTQADDR